MKVWISKYALTQGVFAEEGEVWSGNEHCFSPARTNSYLYHRGQWHRTREQALAKAETLRARKISALEKQIAKLKTLDLETAE